MPRSMKGGSEARTAVMGALELAIDVAYHDGTARELAVADEAYALAGFYDPTCGLSHARREDAARRIERARRGRPYRLLRADARGMLAAFTLLAENGVITYSSCAEARRQRWLERGGHERAA